MCTTHNRLTGYRLLSKTLNDVFDSTFCVYIDFRHTFKYWYRKITEQRQNFANSDRYTNEDDEIFKPRFCFHRPGMEGVLIKGRCSKGTRQCSGDVCPNGGAFVDTTMIDRCRSVSTCGTDGKLLVTYWGRFQDLILSVACTLLQTDHIIVTDSNKCR